MGKHLNKIMTEMFNRVGETYTEEYPKQPQWYLKHSWTEKEQNEFIKWTVDYLYNSKEAREEILTINTRRKVLILKAIRNFMFNYGWKIEND